MDQPRWTADLFQFEEEESKLMNMKNFYIKYKNKLPMLAIFIGGYDGDTAFDCYDNMQVFRIHGISSQQRVVVLDNQESKLLSPKFHTIPVDTAIKFRVIKGYNKFGNIQSLPYILENNKLPVLVRMACDPMHELKIGTSRIHAKTFGHLLITEKYLEHYFMINCIQGLDLELTNHVNLVSLSEELLVSPITGLKHGTKEEFQQILADLTHRVETSGVEFDRTQGNPNFAEYFVKEINPVTFEKGVPTVPHPTIPDLIEVVEENYYEYEEIPPELPVRAAPRTRSPPKKDEAKGKKGLLETIGSKIHQMKPKQGAQKEEKKPNQGRVEGKTIESKVHVPQKYNKPLPQAPPEPGEPNSETLIIDDRPRLELPVDRNDKNQSTGRLKAETIQGNANSNYRNMKIGRATISPYRPEGEDICDGGTADQIYSDVYEDMNPDESGRYVKIKHVSTPSVRQRSSSTELQQSQTLDKISSSPKPGSKQSLSVDDLLSKGIQTMTISEISGVLQTLNLEQYSDVFEQNQVDGEILSSLSPDDLVSELGMKKLEAVRLCKFVESGHIPK